MIRGLPASILAHVAVIGASYVTFPYWSTNTRVLASDLEAVDVNFAEIGEITNIAPLVETEPEEPEEVAPAEPEEPEEVPEDPVEEELPEAEQDVSDVEAAPPEETPEDLLPEFEPEQQEEEDEPAPKPEKKPDPAPRSPNNDLMDFLNQSESTFQSERATREKRPEPKPVTSEPKTALENAPKPAETRNRRGAGERNANTARIEAILYSKIVPCWDNVVDLPFPERLNVQLSVKLNRDGSLADVKFVEPARAPIGNSPMRTAMERAKRAVQKCAPYNLPDDDYDLWSEGAVNLGPAFDAKTQR